MDNESIEEAEIIESTLNEDEPIHLDQEDILVSDDTDNSENPELLVKEEGLSWYIVQCYALYEQKVRDRILQMQENEFKDIVHRVLLPEEETVEIKNNERKEKIKKMFPGYLFVQMKPDEGAWYMLRRLPGLRSWWNKK